MLTSPWIEVANLAYAGLPSRLGRERGHLSALLVLLATALVCNKFLCMTLC